MDIEDDEAPRNFHLRRVALDRAISAYALISGNVCSNDGSHSDVILTITNKFYDFLKGDTK